MRAQGWAAVRPLSKAHLARQLAAEINDAWCEGQGSRWSQWETAHAAARTPTAAAAAAAPAMTMCGRCTEVDRCEDLLRLGDYTGLGAGGAWLNGALRATPLVVTRPAQLDERQAG